MRPRLLLLLALVSLVVPRSGFALAAPHLQFQLDGLASLPVGSYSASDVQARDVFGVAGGFAATVSLGIRRSLCVAARVGASASRKDGTVRFSHPLSAGGLGDPTPYAVRRKLVSVPIHGLLQYRHRLGSLGLTLLAGAGINTSTQHLSVSSAGTPLFAIAGYQQSFSSLFGVGLSYPLAPDWALTLGGTFEQVVTDAGDIWGSGDNPKFFSGTLGVRYPRE